MARVVILSFDDNDAAEAFVTHTLDAQQNTYSHIPIAIAAHVVAHGTIEAVIARPTVSCRCRIVGMTQYYREQGQRKRAQSGKFVDWDGPDRREYVTAMGRWIKTEKFGWLVHDKCNRPAFYVVHRFIQNLIVGYNNLLPAIKEKMNASTDPERTATADGTSPAEGGPDQLIPPAPDERTVLPS